MTDLENLIKQLQQELDGVIAQDKADADNLPFEEVMYNDGWVAGVSRVLTILKGAVSL